MSLKIRGWDPYFSPPFGGNRSREVARIWPDLWMSFVRRITQCSSFQFQDTRTSVEGNISLPRAKKNHRLTNEQTPTCQWEEKKATLIAPFSTKKQQPAVSPIADNRPFWTITPLTVGFSHPFFPGWKKLGIPNWRPAKPHALALSFVMRQISSASERGFTRMSWDVSVGCFFFGTPPWLVL